MEPTTTEDIFGRHLLKTRRTAELLDVSERTLEDWRLRGCGPPFIRLSGRAVRYRPSDLARWVEDRLRSSTSDPGSDGDVRPAA